MSSLLFGNSASYFLAAMSMGMQLFGVDGLTMIGKDNGNSKDKPHCGTSGQNNLAAQGKEEGVTRERMLIKDKESVVLATTRTAKLARTRWRITRGSDPDRPVEGYFIMKFFREEGSPPPLCEELRKLDLLREVDRKYLQTISWVDHGFEFGDKLEDTLVLKGGSGVRLKGAIFYEDDSEGKSLRLSSVRLAKQGKLWKKILPHMKSFITQLVLAVGALHEKNLRHNDIKPDNIVIWTAKDVPYLRLIDYGALSETRGTQEGTLGYQMYSEDLGNFISDDWFAVGRVIDWFFNDSRELQELQRRHLELKGDAELNRKNGLDIKGYLYQTVMKWKAVKCAEWNNGTKEDLGFWKLAKVLLRCPSESVVYFNDRTVQDSHFGFLPTSTFVRKFMCDHGLWDEKISKCDNK